MLQRCGWCISVDCMNLDATLAAVAATPRLLVVSDYDGTLAEFNTDAYAVSTNPTAERALKELAALPDTEVAILSGRHTEGLKSPALMRPILFWRVRTVRSQILGKFGR